MKFFIPSKGFTILEMIVVVSIIGFLLLIVVANYPAFKLQLAQSRVAFVFDQDMRRVQNLSSAAAHYQDAQGNTQPVVGYGIVIDRQSRGNKEYRLYADIPTGNSTINGVEYLTGNEQYDDKDYILETINLASREPGVVIKDIEGHQTSTSSPVSYKTVSINFNSADLGIHIIADTQEQYAVDIIFASESNPSKIKTVSVTKAGLITVH